MTSDTPFMHFWGPPPSSVKQGKALGYKSLGRDLLSVQEHESPAAAGIRHLLSHLCVERDHGDQIPVQCLVLGALMCIQSLFHGNH